ncbi:hypothetical protein ML401_01615 [Bradyrhizobium sp. 62B]|uniref:hypothetical protein n=1 Tax=Bradyrhizobium sp. 62B TaxID=2898442 RepID=UPI0025580A90|nr:hypothetical protein ML401_01615 [Bradyrhizobium sp. 62B]
MFEEWWFERKLGSLQRTRDKIEKSYAKKMHQAFKGRSSVEEKDKLIVSKHMDLEECDDDINRHTTTYLLSQARKLFVEVPDYESETFWFESTTFGGRYLSPAGVTKLRNDIRAERKARWELIQPRIALLVTFVTSLTGVLGAVIGVLSFLKSAPKPPA